jgi:hypothetical protein
MYLSHVIPKMFAPLRYFNIFCRKYFADNMKQKNYGGRNYLRTAKSTSEGKLNFCIEHNTFYSSRITFLTTRNNP